MIVGAARGLGRSSVRSAVLAVLLGASTILPVAAAGNGPTSLSDPAATPGTGTPATSITFSVTYKNAEGSSPDYVNVVIGSATHSMHATTTADNWKHGVSYAFTTTLPVGTWTVRFEAADRNRFMDQVDGPTVTITAPPAPPPAPTPAPTPKSTPAPTPKPTPAPTRAPTPPPTATPGATPGGPPVSGPAATPPASTGSDTPPAATPSPGPLTAALGPGAGGPGDLPGGSASAGSGSAGPAGSGPGGSGPGGSATSGVGVDPNGSTASSGSSTTGWGSGTGSGPFGNGSSGDASISGGSSSILAALVRALPTIVGTTGGITMLMAFMAFGKRRRDSEPTDPDEVLGASAARGLGLVGHSGLVPSLALASAPAAVQAVVAAAGAPETDNHIPRWRRPSLMEARKADPLRSVATGVRLTFEGDVGQAVDGLERRRIRYRLVSLLDAPDEVQGIEIHVLDEGDEVVLLEKRGTYWRVLCPDGRTGWLHKMTLGDVVIDSAAAGAASWTSGDEGPGGFEDVLRAFTEHQRRFGQS